MPVLSFEGSEGIEMIPKEIEDASSLYGLLTLLKPSAVKQMFV